MRFELHILPSGRIGIREPRDGSAGFAAPGGSVLSVVQTLARSQAEGLFLLAAQANVSLLPAELGFWREFSSLYLNELCHIPETSEPPFKSIAPPDDERISMLLQSVPPMVGAEYLTVSVLRGAWHDIDRWVQGEVVGRADGLSGFLAEHAPLWRQVGRVCFHLAENKRDTMFPFAFLATYVPGLSRSARAKHLPLSKALEQYAGAKNKEALLRLLSPVHRASEKSEFIRNLLETGDLFHPMAWTPQEAHQFLKEIPIYEACGVVVRMPDWWQKRPRPQVNVTIGDRRKKVLSAGAMLDFNVSVALGDDSISDSEWQDLLASDDGLVLIKGQWVEVDREKLTRALEHWKKIEQANADGSLSFIEGMRLLAGVPADLNCSDGLDDEEVAWSTVHAGRWLEQTLAELREPSERGKAKPGKHFHTVLRPYQQTGVDWLWLLTQLGLGACLADDMGLGKTIQVLALLVMIKYQRSKPDVARQPSLLVMPASLLANWKAEMERFSPSLVAVLVHPSETEKAELSRMADSPDKRLRGVDVVLTTYGMLQRQEWLKDVSWNVVVLDEAQAIKNPATRQTRSVKQLKSIARVALTGTPVENRLSDLWSIFDFLSPGLLGSAAKFKAFVKMLDTRKHDRYTPLRNLVSPYILRRMKTDKAIISDLPDKSELKAYCGLTKRQAALYEKSVREMAHAMKGLDGMKRRGLVLAFLARFKQICNHPSQLTGDNEYRATDSGKFERLMEICAEIASRQEKVLVFTQFREMTGPIRLILEGVFGCAGLVLHGGTAVRKRQRMVDEFQREDGPPFFVLSLKAGGTGLNLTAASHVIHFDRWWNPAVENQATDRAFRIGQHRNVLVHKFVCRGTIEQRIDEMIEEKQKLAEELLQGGTEKLLTEMSDQQLMDLVALDVSKAMT